MLLHVNPKSCILLSISVRSSSEFIVVCPRDDLSEKQILLFSSYLYFLTEGLKNRQCQQDQERRRTRVHVRRMDGEKTMKTASENKREKSWMIQTNGHWVYELAFIAWESERDFERERKRERERERDESVHAFMCVVCACACICVCVCYNEKKVLDEWQARVCVCVCVCACVCTGVCVGAFKREREREREREKEIDGETGRERERERERERALSQGSSSSKGAWDAANCKRPRSSVHMLQDKWISKTFRFLAMVVVRASIVAAAAQVHWAHDACVMDEAESRSWLKFITLWSWLSRFWVPGTRDSKRLRRVHMTATHVFNRVIQLQRRSQGLVPQRQRIRKVVDLNESFHTHRHDAITGAKKKNFVSNVSSTIKGRITVFCDVHDLSVASGGSRARRHRAHRQLKPVVVHSDPRARQASTSQS